MLCQVGPLKEQEVAKSWTISPGIGEGKGFKLMSSETFEDPCDSFPTLSFFFEEIYIYIYMYWQVTVAVLVGRGVK